jgi:hypothetical protein
MKLEQDMKELEGCTFTPNIENDNSLISSRAMLRAGYGQRGIS